MIHNIGTDFVCIKRIDNLLSKYGQRFVKRILTSAEIKVFDVRKHKTYYLAKRFAAKEAVAKAIGYGIGTRVSFQDIDISNDQNGKPFFYLSKRLKDTMLRKNKVKDYRFHLSLADDNKYASAFVVIEAII